MNTEFSYIYRDASNYKFYKSVIISGKLKLCDIQEYLFDEEFFVPELVGLESLVPDVKNEDDHILHGIFSLCETKKPAGVLRAETLVHRFKERGETGWF
ncbi:MAG: hypothetical protein GEU92_20800 [Alphaproteobacteria bacterium]|nr:hypothetical protein [Alphaproteobacteria bacterium]